MSRVPIVQAAEADKRIRDELVRRFPDLGDDERALLDTLDGLSDFDSQAAAVVRSILIDEGMAAGCSVVIREAEERRDRLKARAKSKRAALFNAMELAQRRKLDLAEATVFIGKNKRKLITTDEDAIPARYWEPQPAKLDRTALAADLAAGMGVEGATLDNGSTSLRIIKG
jgi:hypothetical protein